LIIEHPLLRWARSMEPYAMIEASQSVRLKGYAVGQHRVKHEKAIGKPSESHRKERR
jgi:hypothetical protein